MNILVYGKQTDNAKKSYKTFLLMNLDVEILISKLLNQTSYKEIIIHYHHSGVISGIVRMALVLENL